MSDQDLISQLNTSLSALISTGRVVSNAGPDLFEAYAFELIVRAAIAKGYSVDFLYNDGTVANSLVLRTHPGFMERDVNTYVHARLSYRNRDPLEVHVGVYVSGVSTLPHECDVAILKTTEASWSRQSRALPRSRGLLIGIECKYYRGNVGVDRARNFLGLSKEYKGSKLIFMANSSAPRIRQMLTHHNIDSEDQVMPLTAGDQSLFYLFQRVLGNYAIRRTR